MSRPNSGSYPSLRLKGVQSRNLVDTVNPDCRLDLKTTAGASKLLFADAPHGSGSCFGKGVLMNAHNTTLNVLQLFHACGPFRKRGVRTNTDRLWVSESPRLMLQFSLQAGCKSHLCISLLLQPDILKWLSPARGQRTTVG